LESMIRQRRRYSIGEKMILRDYKYLDTHKVESYLSSLPEGVTEGLKETIKDSSGKEGKAGAKAYFFNAEGKVSSQDETTRESTIKISSQRMFINFMRR
jgi:hypothetical protein